MKIKNCVLSLLLLVMLCMVSLASAAKPMKLAPKTEYQKLPVFCYHNVIDNNRPDAKEILRKDPYVVTASRLEEHFRYFKENGYNVISMQQYMDYVDKGIALPAKPVMITVDDGNDAMYNIIYPLLKKYNYPAVFSIIGNFMEHAPNRSLIERMLTWEQIREMDASGLVTIASHSYNLHNYISNDSYGDRFQNAKTIWYNDEKRFETEADFKERIEDDFALLEKLYVKNLGHKLNVMTWPYGAYNKLDQKIAADYGYEYNLLLNDDVLNTNPRYLSRYIIYGNPKTDELKKMLERKEKTEAPKYGQLDIDMLYDPMPEKFERNISKAIQRLGTLGVNRVVLQTFADHDGDGNVKEVYFYNSQIPVKVDIFNHVIARLKAAGVERVFAWLPLLSYDGQALNIQSIAAEPQDKLGWYNRLSPFDSKTKAFVKTLAHDLAAYSDIDGIMFQDDLYMNDFEDFSPAAKQAYEKRFHKTLTKASLNSEQARKEWTSFKTEALNDLTKIAIDEARRYRPEMETARNIYSALLENPESEEWFAQNYEQYLNNYDYVFVMVYPEMEGAANSVAWTSKIADLALAKPGASEKVVFKLQSYDWKKNVWLTDSALWDREKVIRNKKGKMFAYYPVNVYFER